MIGFKDVIYWGKRNKIKKLRTNIKRGIKLLCQNMALVSVDKYHPFPARDGEDNSQVFPAIFVLQKCGYIGTLTFFSSDELSSIVEARPF